MPQANPSSRQKILDVAEALFARRGYAAVGISAVAKQAGLGKSSLFHHFPSKASLYGAVLIGVLERLEVQVLPALERGRSSREKLGEVIDSLIDALAEHPTSARLLLRAVFEEDDPAVVEAAETPEIDRRLARLIDAVGSVVEAGVNSGEFRSVAVPEVLQTIIGATVYHFASGEFGETLFGGPLFSAEAVSRRKRELKALLEHSLAPVSSRPQGESS